MAIKQRLVPVLFVAPGACVPALAQGPCDTGFVNVPFGHEFSALTVQDETLLIATNRGGVAEWDTATGEHRFYTQGRHCLPSNTVADVAVDGQGNLWAATPRGLAFKTAGTPFEAPWETVSIPGMDDSSRAITQVEAAPDGSIWIGTYFDGMFRRLGDGSWEQVNPDPAGGGAQVETLINSIRFQSNGDLWAGTFGVGLLRFHASSDYATFDWFNTGNTGNAPGEICFLVSPPVDQGLTTNVVFVLGEDANTGDMWFYADDDNPNCFLSSTARFDGQEWYAYNPSNSDIPNPNHTAVVNAADGSLWVVGLNGPLSFSDESFTPITDADGLNPGGFFDATRVGETVWLSTGQGLASHAGADFAFAQPTGLISGHIRAVWPDALPLPGAPERTPDGSAWVGTTQGIQRVTRDGRAHESFAQDDGAPTGRINGLFQTPDGTLWLATQGQGAVTFDGATFSTVQQVFGDVLSAAGINPATGEIWFATPGLFGGLNVSRDGGQTFEFLSADGVGAPIAFTSDIAFAPNGDAWFATNMGAVRFDGTVWETFDTSNGLTNDVLHSVDVGADGVVWIGMNGGSSTPGVTGQGVGRYDGVSWTRFTPVSDTIDGLNRVTDVAVDGDGVVWAGVMQNGLHRWDGREWTAFDSENAIVNDTVLALETTPEGEVWIGTDGGVSIRPATAEPCVADFAEPLGVLDFFDVSAFLGAFSTMSPAADLAEPFGAFDFFDVAAFIQAFAAGCP